MNIVNDKMSKTPETDAAWSCFNGYMEPLQDVKYLSRKLERERDQLKQLLAADSERVDAYLGACIERDEAIEKHRSSVIYWQRDVFKMQRERDEALAEIQRLRLDAQREAEQHDRMVKELEGLYDQLAKTKSSNEHICSLSKDMMGDCIICKKVQSNVSNYGLIIWDIAIFGFQFAALNEIKT